MKTDEEFQDVVNKLNEARAACAVMRGALGDCFTVVRIQNGNLHEDTNLIQAQAEKALSTTCGTTILSALKECVEALQKVSDDWSTSKNPDWDGMCDAVAESRTAITHAKPFVGGGK